jgi:hypothetical protein
MAGQGFRKDAWVRMSQAVGSLWIWMKTKENEPNGGFPSQTFSKWHPNEERVVEIKQEWNLKFGV